MEFIKKDMKKIRTLKANEIEVRTAIVKDGKATQLLYIDSRAATDLLDETYGMENWTIEYKDVAGQIYGRLSVYDTETNRWVFREDTGSPANIEKEKSLASDIVKRCIVRLGVTELYSTPKIVIPDDGYGNTGYKVSEIEYNEDREIIHLVIVNRFNKEVYRWDEGTTSQTEQNSLKTPSKSNLEVLTEFCSSKKLEEGINKDELLKFFKYYEPKMAEWKFAFLPQKMWARWLS